MNESVLVATVAEERVAFRAAQITTVIELDKVMPVPRAPSHVCGIGALRSRGLVVIDCAAALERKPARTPPPGSLGVVIPIEGHFYALLVDAVHDMSEIADGPRPVRTQLAGEWSQLCEGRIDIADGNVMLLDPDAIVAGADQMREVA